MPPGCILPSRRKPRDRHGSAHPRQCNGQAGESAGCESRSPRHFRVSVVRCALFRSAAWRDSAVLPVEPAAEGARVIHSGVERRSRLGEMAPLRPSLSCPRQARSSRKADTAPPGHIPVDSGNRLGAVGFRIFTPSFHPLLSCRAAQKPAAAGKRPGKPSRVGESATHLPALSQ